MRDVELDIALCDYGACSVTSHCEAPDHRETALEHIPLVSPGADRGEARFAASELVTRHLYGVLC